MKGWVDNRIYCSFMKVNVVIFVLYQCYCLKIMNKELNDISDFLRDLKFEQQFFESFERINSNIVVQIK